MRSLYHIGGAKIGIIFCLSKFYRFYRKSSAIIPRHGDNSIRMPDEFICMTNLLYRHGCPDNHRNKQKEDCRHLRQPPRRISNVTASKATTLRHLRNQAVKVGDTPVQIALDPAYRLIRAHETLTVRVPAVIHVRPQGNIQLCRLLYIGSVLLYELIHIQIRLQRRPACLDSIAE